MVRGPEEEGGFSLPDLSQVAAAAVQCVPSRLSG